MMKGGLSTDNNMHPTKQDQPDHLPGASQELSTKIEEQAEDPVSAQPASTGAKRGTSPLTPAKSEVDNILVDSTRVVEKSSKTNPSTKSLTSRDIVDETLDCLAEVEEHMTNFRRYINTQNYDDKPLYQWAKYVNYPALSTTVSKLEKAVTKLKNARIPSEYLAVSVARATSSSTSVSKAAAYAFAVMNKKMASYMEEMENSTLSEEAKTKANVMITEEVQKLMNYPFRAAGQVWLATDLLRKCEQSRTQYKDWAWSAAATTMTAVIAAVVSSFTAYLYGPNGIDLIPKSSHSNGMYTQVLDLVQRTQAVTNLTGEIYTSKLQDIDRRYSDLADLSESHGLRIDNLVEALGPPNEEGIYYISMPKKESGSCKDLGRRIQKVSDEAKRQSQRHQAEMELMRKNINRMNIRLTSSIEKKHKN